MREIEPGRVVEYNQRFRGVVAHVAKNGEWLTVRSHGAEYMIKMDQVVEVLNPEPSEGEVVEHTTCPDCGALRGKSCKDLRYTKILVLNKHPHQSRIDLYIEETGWTP